MEHAPALFRAQYRAESGLGVAARFERHQGPCRRLIRRLTTSAHQAPSVVGPTRNRSAEGGPEAWRNLLAEQVEKPGLVRSRRMEHEVVEPELHIPADPLDRLVGVIGDDPARCGTLDR